MCFKLKKKDIFQPFVSIVSYHFLKEWNKLFKESWDGDQSCASGLFFCSFATILAVGCQITESTANQLLP